MLKRPLIAVIAALAASAVLAQVYKWTDEDGIVHYSDRPAEGAEELPLPAAGTRREPASPPIARKAAVAAEEGTAEAPAFRYDSLSIESPRTGETLWNIEGVLNVTLSAKPALRSGDRLRVYFDGTPRMVGSASFQIGEVYRGEHSIQAEIINGSDTLMIRSAPSRFYVRQNTITRRAN